MANDEAMPPGYPARWETDVALTDGGIARVRPVRPSDASAVSDFHARQPSDDVYFRYFTAMPTLTPRMVDRLTNVDYVDRMGFVAELGDDIIGMAAYDLWPERDTAEVSFMIDHDHQGRGLATVLLEYLAVAAREAGLPSLVAMVLPTNRKMLNVLHRVGFEVHSSFEDGVLDVRLDIEPNPEAQARIEDRARRSEARSVARILSPGSIAVIGAGREAGGLGHELFVNLLRSGFGGPVYPVNPHGGHVASVRAWPSILDVPDEIDLAVLCVPAEMTEAVVVECARKRVRGLVVTSAGFGPPGADAGDLAHRLVFLARRWGMRLIGPESLGVINTQWGVSMKATFADVEVPAGQVGFLTQSGTLGIAALEAARRRGVGISTFVDVGRKVDVSGNDVLQFWEEDPRTSVATLYLESFGNPRTFVRIARRMARNTPIVAVKAGNVAPPARVGSEGEGSWPADATYGSLLEQAGVIRVDALPELFDVARVLLHQQVPTGRRVAVVSNSRGATALTVDALAGGRLDLAALTPDTIGALVGVVPDDWRAGNPVELPFDAGPAEYEAAVAAVMADDGVDACVVVYAPATRDRRHEVARAIGAVATNRVTTVAIFLGAPIDEPLVSGSVRIPLFEFPSEAVRVLGRLADHGDWLAQAVGHVPDVDELGIDVHAAAAILSGVLFDHPGGAWLGWPDVERLAAALGLPVLATREGATVDEAAAAATAVGYPVAIKASGLDRYFRGELGGVALDLRHEDDVREAVARMTELLGTDVMQPIRVQAMSPAGADVLVAAHQHPNVGGVISVGVGGLAGASTNGRPIRVLPLSDADAVRLVDGSGLAASLDVVDAPGRARRHLEDLLVRLAAAVDALPELADLVANPVIVGAEGAAISEIAVRVAPAVIDDLPQVRRLR